MFTRRLLTAATALALVSAAGVAQAGVVSDLTTAGASDTGLNNGAIVVQINPQSTGSGVIDSFVRLSPPNGQTTVVQGYNTEANGVLDTGNSNTFNHDISLSDVPIQTINGVQYREFLLDVNENNNAALDQYISLDEIQIFVGGTPNDNETEFTADGTPTGTLNLDGTLVWRLDQGMDNAIALDYSLNAGSGSGDMFLYVPESLFAGFADDDTVVLYSHFGALDVTDPDGSAPQGDYGVSDGFEEWAVRTEITPPPAVPEPASILLLSLGGLGLFGYGVRRRRKNELAA